MFNIEKFVLKVFAILLAVFSFCTLSSFNSNNYIYADQDEFTVVTSLEQITDMSGKYRLKQQDTAYTYSASLGAFAGVLDGNGCTISYTTSTTDFVATMPLFSSLDYGAVVYNLSFAPTDNNSQSVYFGATDSASQKTSYGILADTINNAKVYGIQFSNTKVYLYDNNALIATSELNIGLLAGQISGSNINQIKITNCAILPFEKEQEQSYIRSNFNVGLLAGKISGGTRLQNNYISKSSMTINIADSLTQSHNLGGLVGMAETGYLANNIVANTASAAEYSVNFKGTNKYLNFGYIVGKTTSANISLYNNIVDLSNDLMLTLTDENINSGLIIGQMSVELGSEDLQGFMTNYSGNYVSNIQNELFVSKYANIYKIDLENLFASKMQDYTLWNGIYAWDFARVWKTSSTSLLPNLQYFEKYSITFSSTDSVKSLSIEKVPTLSDATQSVVNSEFTLLNVDNAQTGSSLSVSYGKSVKLSTSITNINNYNKYFKISGLLLNGVKIFEYDYETQTATTYNGYQVTGEPNAETGGFDFEINDFIASNAGTYSVQLLRNVFKLKINVLELEVNEKMILPGKIKSNMASDGSSEIVIDMQYGTKYTYETYDVNSDYAKEADWYLYNLDVNDSEFTFDLENRSTSFVSRNNLEWTFDENCVLFGLDIADDTTDYLTLNDYYYDKDNLLDENTNIFATTVVFSKDVKDIEIRFKFDDEEAITEKVADVVIDDGSVSLTYVEADGYYKAKIRYSNKTHVISLKGVSTDYTFDGWYLNSRMPQATNDTYGGTFEIVNDGDASTVVIYAVFTKEKVNDGANLLWLWIALAGVGLVLVVVVIVVIAKKKKAGASSYKKYMY